MDQKGRNLNMSNSNEMEKCEIDILYQLYKQDREEILQRNKQRDNYALQYIASVIAILAASTSCDKPLIAIPLMFPGLQLIGCYYRYQFKQSYGIHKLLVAHIKVLEHCLINLMSEQYQENIPSIFFQTFVDHQDLQPKTRYQMLSAFITVISVIGIFLAIALSLCYVSSIVKPWA